MVNSKELRFITEVLEFPPVQAVEEVGSQIHETKRVPDPYVHISKDGKLLTLLGENVEDYIVLGTELGKSEAEAFGKIQDWANEENEGTVVWFSPPYENVYPASKVVVSEIVVLENDEKVLFNRAIVLDIDEVELTGWAQNLGYRKGLDPEELRREPIFCGIEETESWLLRLEKVSPQMEMIKETVDVELKMHTYDQLREEGNFDYYGLHKAATQRRMIGKYVGSCGERLQAEAQKTLFEKFSEGGMDVAESTKSTDSETRNFVYRCYNCNRKIYKVIKSGYVCKCGRVYGGC